MIVKPSVNQYLRRHPAPFLLGLQALIVGTILAIAPHDTIIGSGVLHTFAHPYADFIWPIFYAIGGALTIAGMLRLHPPCESAGLVLVSFCIAFYVLAIIAVGGIANTFIAVSILTVTVLGPLARVASIIQRGKGR